MTITDVRLVRKARRAQWYVAAVEQWTVGQWAAMDVNWPGEARGPCASLRALGVVA